MTNQNRLKERRIEKVKREQAPVPWHYFLMGTICAVIMGIGFFSAAKQHFSSVEYSMKNSEMRKARQNLEAEQRKLRVEREEVSVPAAIEKAGLKIGLRKYSSGAFQFIETARNSAPQDNEKTAAGNVADNKKPADKSDASKITRTVSVRPVDAGKKEQAPRGSRSETAKTNTKEIGRALIAKK